MLYVKQNEHKDMYFVCEDVIKDGWKIVKVFYSERIAYKYIADNLNVRSYNGNV